MKEHNELKVFVVYQSDSAEDAAKKLVQNLRLDEGLVKYFAAYIQEQRLEMGEAKPTPPNNTNSHHNNNSKLPKIVKLISNFVINTLTNLSEGYLLRIGVSFL